MRLSRLWLVILVLFLIASQASAGPFQRARDRRASASGCGATQATATTGCGAAATVASGCDSAAVSASPTAPIIPAGVTFFTDSNGNLWSMVKTAPVKSPPSK